MSFARCVCLSSVSFAMAWGVVSTEPAIAVTATYSYTVDGSSTGVGSGPYGTVTVKDTGGVLDFTVSLNSPYQFHDSNSSQQNSFLFDLVGAPRISISGLTANFARIGSNPASGGSFGGPSFNGTGFWDYGVDGSCPGNTCGTALHFVATHVDASNNPIFDLSLASLNPLTYTNSSGKFSIYFVSALINTNTTPGLTGNVGATRVDSNTPVDPVPLPPALVLFGTALIGMTVLGRRRRTT
jgi:hypothetical protein